MESELSIFRAIKNARHLSSCNIVVEVVDGKVILRGRVRSFYLKQIAQEVTRRAINGASLEMDNQISVE